METKNETELKAQRKGIARFRVSILLIILSLITFGYIIYEIIALCTK